MSSTTFWRIQWKYSEVWRFQTVTTPWRHHWHGDHTVADVCRGWEEIDLRKVTVTVVVGAVTVSFFKVLFLAFILIYINKCSKQHLVQSISRLNMYIYHVRACAQPIWPHIQPADCLKEMLFTTNKERWNMSHCWFTSCLEWERQKQRQKKTLITKS